MAPLSARRSGTGGAYVVVLGDVGTEVLQDRTLAALDLAGVPALLAGDQVVAGFPLDQRVDLVCRSDSTFEPLDPPTGAAKIVGLWDWPLPVLPGIESTAFDEVWVGSAAVADGLRARLSVPVRAIALPAWEVVAAPRCGAPWQALVILEGADLATTVAADVVEAWRRAFADRRDVRLRVRVSGAAASDADVESFDHAAAELGNLDLDLQPASVSALRACLADSDCVLSLDRCIAFALWVRAAIAQGVPLVAVGHPAIAELVDDEQAFLVAYAAEPSCHFGAQWARPDLEVAAYRLREVHQDPPKAVERARRAQARAEAAVAPMVEALQDGLGRLLDDAPSRNPTDTDSVRATDSAAQERRLSRAKATADTNARVLERGQRRLDERLAAVELRRAGGPDLFSGAAALPFMEAPWLERFEVLVAGEVVGFRGSPGRPAEDPYAAFESVFRGTRERVLELVAPYVDLLAGRAPVLDVGCGRGELLELLRDAGVAASGVDSDAGMAAAGRAGGLDIAVGDAIEYLEDLPDDGLGAVTAIQVIEHLPQPALLRLFALAMRKLRPGGVLVTETVNPHAPAALKTFWVDLTHQHPIYPEVALALARAAGFGSAYVTHLRGERVVERDRFAQDSYALVAERASASAEPSSCSNTLR